MAANHHQCWHAQRHEYLSDAYQNAHGDEKCQLTRTLLLKRYALPALKARARPMKQVAFLGYALKVVGNMQFPQCNNWI
jgi:hypothetical protein